VKRVLEVVAITLLVAGIELATGAVSYGLDQIVRVFQHLMAGSEPEISVPRFLGGVGMVVLGSGLVLLDLWARAYSGFVGRGKYCRTRHKVLGWVLGERVTYRKCKTCGWHGLTGGP